MHWWHIPALVTLFLVPYLGEVLIRRAKRRSERWQQRSERQQRILARLPGAVLMLATFLVLDWFDLLR